MSKLGIAFRTGKDYEISNLISILRPITDQIESEIIVINNHMKDLLIDDYRIEKYDGVYENYIEHISSICSGKRLLLLEDGYVLDKTIIQKISQAIEKYQEYTITADIKVYLDSTRDNFFICQTPIVYSVGTTGTKKIEIEIEDEALIDASKEDLQWILQKLIYHDRIKELVVWYRDTVLYSNDDFIYMFYQTLEKIKLDLSECTASLLENGFLSLSLTNNYSSYLKLKRLMRIGNGSCAETVKNLALTEKDTFFSFILHEAFVKKDFVLEIAKTLDAALLKPFINYLLVNIDDFYKVYHDYIFSIDLTSEISIKNNKNIEIYKNLILYYIEAMAPESYEAEKRHMLAQMFVAYVNCTIYYVNQKMKRNKSKLLDGETRFIIEADKAIDYVNRKDIHGAETILKQAAFAYPIIGPAVDYYIQELKFENEIYDYKVSICMIVKNEERNLERCLVSLKPLVDSNLAELVIVDTGSGDRTVEIAESFTDKVFHHPWRDSFSDARNYSISLAKGEYIFIFDADEELESGGAERLLDIFSGSELDGYNTATLVLKNFSDLELKRYSYLTQALIFRNDGTFNYSGVVHNQPLMKSPIKHFDIKVLHYGYIMTEETKDKKFLRTASLLKRELSKDPDNLYYRFQLSVSYSMHGDASEALEQVEVYMDQIKDREFEYSFLALYSNAVRIYFNNSKYDKVLEVCNHALNFQPDYIDFIYHKALALYEKEMYRAAINSINDYFDVRKDFFSREISHDMSSGFYTVDLQDNVTIVLLQCNYYLEKYQEVLDIAKTIDDHDIIKRILPTLIESYIEINDYSGLANFYADITAKDTDNLNEVFIYLTTGALQKCQRSEQERFLEALSHELSDERINLIKIGMFGEAADSSGQFLHFLDTYDLDDVDIITAGIILKPVKSFLDNYVAVETIDPTKLYHIKLCSRFILNRTLNFEQIKGFRDEELLEVLHKYIAACSKLVALEEEALTSEAEREFVENISRAFDELEAKDLSAVLKYIKQAALRHKEMAKPLTLLIKSIISKEEKVQMPVREPGDEMEKYAESVKRELEGLILGGFLEDAKLVIGDYETMISDDADIYSMKSIILMQEGNLAQAEKILLQGIKIDPYNVDLLFNAGYLYQSLGNIDKAVYYYGKVKDISDDDGLIEEVQEILNSIAL